jgi:hypothetical protein
MCPWEPTIRCREKIRIKDNFNQIAEGCPVISQAEI